MYKGFIVYEENKPKVKRALQEGLIEYLDLSRWSFIDNFFGFLLSANFFKWSAQTYPTPRVKQEVPVWFLLSCSLQMKLHTTASFHALPGILRSGSILTRLKFNLGEKNGGFNRKNKKPRKTAVDQDTVRKYFKTTNPFAMQLWFNHDVVKWIRRHRGFDKRGRFILDRTYLFVPDNENYEQADLLPFDKNDNLVDPQNMTEDQLKEITWRYCYGLTTLLHISQIEGELVYIYAGAELAGGKRSALKASEQLVEGLVEAIGKGVIKELIMDRGFLKGEMIAKWKEQYKIDSLIPLKRNMQAFTDVLGLARLKGHKWHLYREEKGSSKEIVVKEEITGFANITSWDSCTVPLRVALMRKTEKNKEEQIWALASTKTEGSYKEFFEEYDLRAQIEERHRQFKLYWWIAKFTSTDFSLVCHHVLFSILVYTLIQLYLSRKQLQSLANKTINSLKQEEKLGTNTVIVYARQNFATFDVDEFAEILLELKEPSRIRLLKWIKVFKQRKIRSP